MDAPFSDATTCAPLLRTLGDEARLAILAYLAAGPATVAEVARELGVPHYQASRHLTALSRIGVVLQRREGRRVSNSLASAPPVLELGCCRLDLTPHLPREHVPARPSETG